MDPVRSKNWTFTQFLPWKVAEMTKRRPKINKFSNFHPENWLKLPKIDPVRNKFWKFVNLRPCQKCPKSQKGTLPSGMSLYPILPDWPPRKRDFSLGINSSLILLNFSNSTELKVVINYNCFLIAPLVCWSWKNF